MDKQRVNKVTVMLSDNGDGAKVTLYRTNTKLGEVNNISIGVPSYTDSKLPNKQLYVNYCREAMINLLKNDGVDGYYYDPENHASNTGIPKKFDKSVLASYGRDVIQETVAAIQIPSVEFNILEAEDDIAPVNVQEYYADNFIKYGQADYKVKFTKEDMQKIVLVSVNIKSGQLCKPKTMIVDGTQKNLNALNINAFFGTSTTPKLENKIPEIKVDTTKIQTSEYTDPNEDEAVLAVGQEIIQAPVNQEFEGEKPVVEKVDIVEDAKVENIVNNNESTGNPTLDAAIEKMGTGALGTEDIAKLKEMIGGGKVNANVANLMNLIKGDNNEQTKTT